MKEAGGKSLNVQKLEWGWHMTSSKIAIWKKNTEMLSKSRGQLLVKLGLYIQSSRNNLELVSVVKSGPDTNGHSITDK